MTYRTSTHILETGQNLDKPQNRGILKSAYLPHSMGLTYTTIIIINIHGKYVVLNFTEFWFSRSILLSVSPDDLSCYVSQSILVSFLVCFPICYCLKLLSSMSIYWSVLTYPTLWRVSPAAIFWYYPQIQFS